MAIVTGGAGAIGLAVARRCQASGASLSLWDLGAAWPSPEDSDGDDDWQRLTVDVTDYEAVRNARDDVLREFGRIDILVNNAGISGPTQPVMDYGLADWRRIIDINLTGVFHCSRAIAPVMRDQGYGRIINMASLAGKEGTPNAAAYSASKAGVIAFTKSLGKELAKTGVLVNCIAPAAIETPLLDQMTEEHVETMLAKSPMGRFGTVAEVAAVVAWLASEDCSFSTGATFDLSGGRATY